MVRTIENFGKYYIFVTKILLLCNNQQNKMKNCYNKIREEFYGRCK